MNYRLLNFSSKITSAVCAGSDFYANDWRKTFNFSSLCSRCRSLWTHMFMNQNFMSCRKVMKIMHDMFCALRELVVLQRGNMHTGAQEKCLNSRMQIIFEMSPKLFSFRNYETLRTQPALAKLSDVLIYKCVGTVVSSIHNHPLQVVRSFVIKLKFPIKSEE